MGTTLCGNFHPVRALLAIPLNSEAYIVQGVAFGPEAEMVLSAMAVAARDHLPSDYKPGPYHFTLVYLITNYLRHS
jgi:hypothetical protein